MRRSWRRTAWGGIKKGRKREMKRGEVVYYTRVTSSMGKRREPKLTWKGFPPFYARPKKHHDFGTGLGIGRWALCIFSFVRSIICFALAFYF